MSEGKHYDYLIFALKKIKICDLRSVNLRKSCWSKEFSEAHSPTYRIIQTGLEGAV